MVIVRMKFSLLGMFLASPLMLVEQHASAQYIEPAWFPIIEDTFVGVNLQRCEKRAGMVPSNGQRCGRKPKTCFFGNQDCSGTPYPESRCFCNFRAWQCTPELCPGLDAPTDPPVIISPVAITKTCSDFMLDFETRGDGESLTAGGYISTEWLDEYGIEVSASSTSGYTPNNMPRLFDTSAPGNFDNGDPDLGSPNQLCVPSGPGVGTGGVPGAAGANCVPQGLVLIVQETDKVSPDDNAEGGTITFDFAFPTDVKSVGLMDIGPGAVAPSVGVTGTNDMASSFNAQGLGDNSVQDVSINVMDAKQVQITFPGSGAVTYLELCVHSGETVAPGASVTSSPSSSQPSKTPSPPPTKEPSTLAPVTAPPTDQPSLAPFMSSLPSQGPSVSPVMALPSRQPSFYTGESASPSGQPSLSPVMALPSRQPSVYTGESTSPSGPPSIAPVTASPAEDPSIAPVTALPSREPSVAPVTPLPSEEPSLAPVTGVPSREPSLSPVTPLPSREPSLAPVTPLPSLEPSLAPVTPLPSKEPSLAPVTTAPSQEPSLAPVTAAPSQDPSLAAMTAPPTTTSQEPSVAPPKNSVSPSWAPSFLEIPPTWQPSISFFPPTKEPSFDASQTWEPSTNFVPPTWEPSMNFEVSPTWQPTSNGAPPEE